MDEASAVNNKRQKRLEATKAMSAAAHGGVVASAAAAAGAAGEGPSADMEVGRVNLFYSLDGDNSEVDRSWILSQNRFNDERNEKKVLTYPYWNIIHGKSVATMFQFSDGKRNVVFKTNTEKKKESITISTDEWEDFVDLDRMLIQAIMAAEGKLAGVTPEDVLVMGLNEPEIKEYYGWKQYPININKSLRVIFKWKPENKSCMIDLRRGEEKLGGLDNTVVYWRGNPEEGMCFGAGGFSYFARFILPKVRNALSMYVNMYFAGGLCWEACLTTYKPEQKEAFAKKGKQLCLLDPVENKVEYHLSHDPHYC